VDSRASTLAPTLGGTGRAARHIGGLALALLAAGAIVLSLAIVRSNHSFPVTAGALLAGLAGVAYLARRGDDFRLWATYIVGFIAFAELRTIADDTGIAARTRYVIDLESAIFGSIPTVELQSALNAAGTGAFDVAMVGVYLTYFVAPHLVALALWRYRRGAVAPFVAAILLTAYIGLAVSFVLPTTPPWLAAEQGEIAPVERIIRTTIDGGSADAAGFDDAEAVVSANEVAAMPSLHMALTVVIALGAWRYGRTARIASLLYAAAMGLALVYLGEHYVADLAFGALAAALAWFIATRRWPLRE
jgi:membrane-associated phospholipid phosphatase